MSHDPLCHLGAACTSGNGSHTLAGDYCRSCEYYCECRLVEKVRADERGATDLEQLTRWLDRVGVPYVEASGETELGIFLGPHLEAVSSQGEVLHPGNGRVEVAGSEMFQTFIFTPDGTLTRSLTWE